MYLQEEFELSLLLKGSLFSTYKEAVTTLSGSTPLFPFEEHFQTLQQMKQETEQGIFDFLNLEWYS